MRDHLPSSEHLYIFDVDGTLTPSRQEMDGEFQKWFMDFCEDNLVFLITGSDREKTLEQVGIDIYYMADRVYNCSGNHVFEQGKEIYKTDWKLPDNAAFFLLDKLADSGFWRKTGHHIDERPGMVNFSIVGRKCNLDERAMYRDWDSDTHERRIIAEEFNSKFPDIEALVAGETGLDIFPRGSNKGQIWPEISHYDVHFFGDKMDEGGNDYPLAVKNIYGTNHHVANWQHTFKILRRINESKINKLLPTDPENS